LIHGRFESLIAHNVIMENLSLAALVELSGEVPPKASSVLS